jgi:cytochrome c-type biogenesis protein CcmH/NrfG
MTPNTPDLEQIELLTEELADLDRQVANGDLDTETADRLRARYSEELSALVESRTDSAAVAEVGKDSSRMLSGRSLAGIIVVGIAVVAIAVFAVVSLNDDSTSGVEGIAQDVLAGEGGRDLASVTNEELEAVVSQNPDIVPMRLALARRYFDAGEFDKALDHYFEVLEREQHPEALANIGWMTYLSGVSDVAASYLEAAVQRDPTFLNARWFLGNVYASLGRNDEAIVMLAMVVNAEETPDEIRDLAIELISRLDDQSG